MLEAISRNIAIKLKKNNPESDVDVEVLEYGIAMKLNKYGVILITVTLGTIFGHLYESILALVALAAIRRFSGGAHFSSLTACMIISSLFCVITPMILLSKTTAVVLTLVSVCIYYFRAPNWFEELTVHKNDILYKYIAMLIVSGNLILQSSVIAIVFFVQALTLLPKGGVKDEKEH